MNTFETMNPQEVRKLQVIVPEWMEKVLSEAEAQNRNVQVERMHTPFGTYTIGVKAKEVEKPVMEKSLLEIKRKNAKKRNIASRENSLKKYEEKQAEIEKLLKQIAAGLQAHDRNASGQGGHHWGHVGDLNRIAGELRDINDRLHGKGEYAE